MLLPEFSQLNFLSRRISRLWMTVPETREKSFQSRRTQVSIYIYFEYFWVIFKLQKFQIFQGSISLFQIYLDFFKPSVSIYIYSEYFWFVSSFKSSKYFRDLYLFKYIWTFPNLILESRLRQIHVIFKPTNIIH